MPLVLQMLRSRCHQETWVAVHRGQVEECSGVQRRFGGEEWRIWSHQRVQMVTEWVRSPGQGERGELWEMPGFEGHTEAWLSKTEVPTGGSGCLEGEEGCK